MKRFLTLTVFLVTAALASTVNFPVIGNITVNAGAGDVTAGDVSDSIQGHLAEIRDTVAQCSSAVAALAHGVISNGDSFPALHGADTTGWIYYNAAGDTVWTRWMIPHNILGPYHSVGIHETCATNENLAINFGVGGGNVHSVVVGATLDTLTLTSGSDGGRYLVTVLDLSTEVVTLRGVPYPGPFPGMTDPYPNMGALNEPNAAPDTTPTPEPPAASTVTIKGGSAASLMMMH